MSNTTPTTAKIAQSAHATDSCDLWHFALTLNGTLYAAWVSPWNTLLDLPRECARLFGVEKGCAFGQCDSCTVLLDGARRWQRHG